MAGESPSPEVWTCNKHRAVMYHICPACKQEEIDAAIAEAAERFFQDPEDPMPTPPELREPPPIDLEMARQTQNKLARQLDAAETALAEERQRAEAAERDRDAAIVELEVLRQLGVQTPDEVREKK